MVDILPETQAVIGHGAFSVVYKACLKAVSTILLVLEYTIASSSKLANCVGTTNILLNDMCTSQGNTSTVMVSITVSKIIYDTDI